MKNPNWCPNCKELWLYTAIMSHSNTRDEQPVNPRYCALCGAKLIDFPGWEKRNDKTNR